ncbi:MAG: hypothetical protein A2945_04260 [Candidatus Liptonbacteria bacterium RIFCSPLOWO2_01_FULL_52_25]|uniref:Uncharacterized protein n=1 Tax=Candidatus Liptonbacteria bacterium RIFCSPLOWO2_01_FULL_52_25 TaxID=1798650 RepID=A0A1G2CCP8_9BACT|nr:MAG: hypothetical protein A2945_04260 [Candidatus Liptonbacteria bacterium RIFCSPLOWO2_01_FULL_52_25]
MRALLPSRPVPIFAAVLHGREEREAVRRSIAEGGRFKNPRMVAVGLAGARRGDRITTGQIINQASKKYPHAI